MPQRPTRKPRALHPRDPVSIIAPSSPFERDRFQRGCGELQRLGYRVTFDEKSYEGSGYLAGPAAARRDELLSALRSGESRAVVCARGGYGAAEILDGLDPATLPERARILLGFSDATALQVFLWQTRGWVTFYGPMVAAGFDAGAGAAHGYDAASLEQALTNADGSWDVKLEGEAVVAGAAEGTLLGGCLTILQTTIGTAWQLDARGAILLLEDRAMKPYQIDRALVHLRQAGMLDGVRGFLLGDFPECDPGGQASTAVPSVRDAIQRVLAPLGVPIVYGAPIGHTARSMLTVPLGVDVRLESKGQGRLAFLEGAVEE